MGWTIFKIAFEVVAVVLFLIFFIAMGDDLDAIRTYLRRMSGSRRQGGDGEKSMSKMLEEFIGRPCKLQAEGVDEEDVVVLLEVDEEWLKVSYMEAVDRRGIRKKEITRLIRLEDVTGVTLEEDIEEIVMEGGARPEPPEE